MAVTPVLVRMPRRPGPVVERHRVGGGDVRGAVHAPRPAHRPRPQRRGDHLQRQRLPPPAQARHPDRLGSHTAHNNASLHAAGLLCHALLSSGSQMGKHKKCRHVLAHSPRRLGLSARTNDCAAPPAAGFAAAPKQRLRQSVALWKQEAGPAAGADPQRHHQGGRRVPVRQPARLRRRPAALRRLRLRRHERQPARPGALVVSPGNPRSSLLETGAEALGPAALHRAWCSWVPDSWT